MRRAIPYIPFSICDLAQGTQRPQSRFSLAPADECLSVHDAGLSTFSILHFQFSILMYNFAK